MAEGVHIYDSADKVPPQQPQPQPPRPKPAHFDARPHLVLGLFALVAALVLTLIVYALYALLWRDSFDMRPGDWFALCALATLPVCAFGFAIVCLYSALRGTMAQWRMSEVAYSAAGMPLLWNDLAHGNTAAILPGLHANAAEAHRLRAERSQYHQLSTLSVTGARADTPVLPAGDDSIPAVAPGEWLLWLDQAPHVLLAAETGGGKSTLAKHILARRIDQGEEVFVIDPHASEWFSLPVAGAGENWQEVALAMEAVQQEYQNRQRARADYLERNGREMPVEQWKRLTIVLDEANNARAALPDKVWRDFTQALGSGARKVRISIVLLAQSALVQDLGLSGAMRENFTRLALDSGAARKFINAEESDATRRKALNAVLAGVQWPAVAEHHGQVHVLDRQGLDRVTTPVNARACAWSVWSEMPETGHNGAPVSDTDTDSEPMNDVQKLAQLVELRKQGYTREYVRDQLGLKFNNDDWKQAGKIPA